MDQSIYSSLFYSQYIVSAHYGRTGLSVLLFSCEIICFFDIVILENNSLHISWKKYDSVSGYKDMIQKIQNVWRTKLKYRGNTFSTLVP